MRLWSLAMAAGIPNELFWELTIREVEAWLDRRAEEEKRLNLLAGLVAATIVNVNRRKGARMVKPQDFFRARVRNADDYMSVGSAQQFLMGWAKRSNKAIQQEAQAPGESA